MYYRSTRLIARLACSVMVMLPIALGACGNPFVPLGQGSTQLADDAAPVLVRIATCWSGLPLAEDLVAAYGAEGDKLSIDVMPATSRIAEELLAAGQADLAIVERPSEGASFSGESKGLDAVPLALGAVGIVVHRDSALRRLSSSELAEIYAGHRLDWSELRAGSGRVEIVAQESGSLACQILETRIMGRRVTSSAAIVMPHDRGVIEYIAQRVGAIGYVAVSHVDARVKLVALEDVLPTLDEVRRGRYPLTYQLVALTLPGVSPEVAQFLAFVSSGTGRRAIGQRHVPLNTPG